MTAADDMRAPSSAVLLIDGCGTPVSLSLLHNSSTGEGVDRVSADACRASIFERLARLRRGACFDANGGVRIAELFAASLMAAWVGS